MKNQDAAGPYFATLGGQTSKKEAIRTFLLDSIPICCNIKKTQVANKALHFYKTLHKKYVECSYHRDDPEFQTWLANDFKLSPHENCEGPGAQPSGCKVGRPRKPIEMAGPRTKKRRIESLTKEETPEALLSAASTSLNKSGDRLKAQVVTAISSLPNSEMGVIKSMIEQPPPAFVQASPAEALALMLELSLSVRDYLILRQRTKTTFFDFKKRGWREKPKFPIYPKVLQAKKDCYPLEPVTITETSAEIKLQALLDHTMKRFFEAKPHLLSNIEISEEQYLLLILKAGVDGSSGQAQYKLPFADPQASDASLFSTCLVPIELKNGDDVIWRNPAPNSTRFCRPIRFAYEKETQAQTFQVIRDLQSQINNLIPSVVKVDDREILVNSLPFPSTFLIH